MEKYAYPVYPPAILLQHRLSKDVNKGVRYGKVRVPGVPDSDVRIRRS